MVGDSRWSLELERRAERDLERLDPQVASRVIAALDRLRARDPSLDLRRLQGSDEWRLRVGEWRVRLRRDFGARTSSWAVSWATKCAAPARNVGRSEDRLGQGRARVAADPSCLNPARNPLMGHSA